MSVPGAGTTEHLNVWKASDVKESQINKENTGSRQNREYNALKIGEIISDKNDIKFMNKTGVIFQKNSENNRKTNEKGGS